MRSAMSAPAPAKSSSSGGDVSGCAGDESTISQKTGAARQPILGRQSPWWTSLTVQRTGRAHLLFLRLAKRTAVGLNEDGQRARRSFNEERVSSRLKSATGSNYSFNSLFQFGPILQFDKCNRDQLKINCSKCFKLKEFGTAFPHIRYNLGAHCLFFGAPDSQLNFGPRPPQFNEDRRVNPSEARGIRAQFEDG